MRKVSRTQIIATIGPATSHRSTIDALISHQMDVARLNMSWGTHEEAAHVIRHVRAGAREANRDIPIMLDLAGPRVQEAGAHRFKGGTGSVITEKDKRDIAFGVSHNVEIFGLSFVGHSKDVDELRAILAKHKSSARIVAKIERQLAITNLESIIATTDAVMVARGDLGNELPIERIPFVQYSIVRQANAAQKAVIVATEMLPSMIESGTPTRSDVTDVVFAVLTGADAVMLSNETAIGKFPVQAVATMEKIVVEAEKHGSPPRKSLMS